ncbi:DUF4269 domain-containing protein [Salmonirosea aquatica]|uniref:DUF4269 domain-containing protein n=1 Tax=Salmonirosea aquatica TaxID=2654236 RepID=A0A7C9BKN6_9BACT|nr:DUF4269 domain-containing protein [Cytophagaceae bacterium SJW1-29]
MPQPLFSDITYLREGTPTQRRAYHALIDLGIFDKLKAYSPLLTGTIPLDIDIDGSDLDIICYWQFADEYIQTVRQHWGYLPDFQLRHYEINGFQTLVARFSAENFVIEVFGQNRPTHQQEAYRHMVLEYEILQKMGPAFKTKIRELKKSGLKTEPAFAQLLGLQGNPYQALLDYEYKK